MSPGLPARHFLDWVGVELKSALDLTSAHVQLPDLAGNLFILGVDGETNAPELHTLSRQLASG